MNDEKRAQLGLLPKIEAPPMTDTDIVVGLQSEDEHERQRALEALFPDGSAVIIHSTGKQVRLSTTKQMDAGRIFNGLLFLSQEIGRYLGLQLHWIPTGDPNANKLVIAPAGAVPS